MQALFLKSPFRIIIGFICLWLLLAGSACSRKLNSYTATAVSTTQPLLLTDTPVSLTNTPFPSVTPTSSETPSLTPTVTPTKPQTPTATITLTPTITPTYAILRGKVLVHSQCLYGPGAPYLYKYGLLPGSNLEVIGRTDSGSWVLVRAIGGNNPCWVKASLMDIKGDVMTVSPTYIPLPMSPYYAPPKWVQAKRTGNEVLVYWQPVSYRAGDETASPPYLIEAWVCQDGKLVFMPIGTYDVQIKIVDEPGCSEPSHARLYFVEKHGYSRWIKIPWPATG